METKNQIQVVTKNVTEEVLQKVLLLQKNEGLKLPADYSPENALKSAYLILSETVDKDKKPVLESCSKVSIANSLLDMVTKGLNPAKKQCYFIAYGGKLTMSESYFGKQLNAKRAGLEKIKANVIYKNDIFEYEVDSNTGLKKITKHIQKIENIDLTNITGAYAVYQTKNGDVDVEIMNINQIRKAWSKGFQKGIGDVHKDFTDEMAKRTVINRACKTIINSGDDAYLYANETENESENESENETIDMPVEDFEVVKISENVGTAGTAKINQISDIKEVKEGKQQPKIQF